MKSDRTLLILGVVLFAVVVAGPMLPQWALFLLTIAIAKGLVAQGLMLQLRAGLVSFGQALYYCIGAYTAGSLGRFFGIGDMLLQMITGALVAAIVAFILGFSTAC
jgi:ABC-type branched-subunit amino acid transport system permease subunit